jgi:coproporphyrinogen III oxidase
MNKFFNNKYLEEQFLQIQKEITIGLQQEDGKEKFVSDFWERAEGGGGESMVISQGNVFEKGGVNFSAVFGKVPDFLVSDKEHSVIKTAHQPSEFYATGVSLVIHPFSPLVPIIHMNIRYFEMDNGVWWFGGGIDLTPIYIDKNDASNFHKTLKSTCDKHDVNFYPKFKKWADDYFFISHRNETRGIGGVFFDRLNTDSTGKTKEELLAFVLEIGKTFLPSYLPIVSKKKNIEFSESQKNWQLLRRGRYVEFNLVYDKGTKFGLETNGRIESILMSLPLHASWEYNLKIEQESKEYQTQQLLKKEIEWI